MTIIDNHIIIHMTKLTISMQNLRKLKIYEKKKTQTNAGDYTNKIGNISATKSCRELKLVSNDHFLSTIDKKKYLRELYPHQNTTDTDVYTDRCKRA